MLALCIRKRSVSVSFILYCPDQVINVLSYHCCVDVAVWRTDNGIDHISEVSLCQVWLVLAWMTIGSCTILVCYQSHTHTTVLLLFWNMSGTTRVSRYQKGKTRKVKTNLDLLEQEIVSGSDICLAICESAPHPRQPRQHPTTQSLQAGCPSYRPTNSNQSTEGSCYQSLRWIQLPTLSMMGNEYGPGSGGSVLQLIRWHWSGIAWPCVSDHGVSIYLLSGINKGNTHTQPFYGSVEMFIEIWNPSPLALPLQYQWIKMLEVINILYETI